MSKKSRIPLGDCPEGKTPIGNPKQCRVFDIQEDGAVKTMFLSDDNGVHVNLLKGSQ